MLNKVYKIFKSQLDKPEYFFAYTAALFGLAFALIIPPLQTPDEYTHFLRAYQTSELKIPNQIDQEGVKGSTLPRSIAETGHELVPGGLMGDRNVKYDIGHVKAALLDLPLNKGDESFYRTASSPAYNPLVYIPHAATVGVLKVVEAPVVMAIYALRIMNLALWVGLIFLAIKIFPYKKWAVAILALLPMAVAQSVSSGVDVLLLGSAVLLLAVILHLRESKIKITYRHIAAIILLGSILVFCKTNSIVLLLLILLLKNNQFKNAKIAIFAKLFMLIIPVLMYVIWIVISKDITASAENLNMRGQDTGDQVRYLLANPLWFLIVCFNMIFFNYSDTIFQSIVGVFGAYDTPLPVLFVILGYCLITFVLFTNSSREREVRKLDPKTTLFVAMVSVAYMVSIGLAMYVYATPVASPLISGIQGRYYLFIPFLLILLFAGYGVAVKHINYVRIIKTGSILLLSAGAVTIFLRYYVEVPTFPIF